jgi:acetyl esterase/lipase
MIRITQSGRAAAPGGCGEAVAFALEPEVEQVLGPVFALMRDAPRAAAGDVAARRSVFDGNPGLLDGGRPFPAEVDFSDHRAPASDGTDVLLRWYARPGQQPGSAAVYLHGGGMIMGNIDLYHGTVGRYVAEAGVPMLAVEYRVAPEYPGAIPVQDCYTGLCWLAANAERLGVDPARLAVMGDSGGGGLAAGLAILARDRGEVSLAQQILVYPMLDDRTVTPNPELEPTAMWSYADNVTAWDAVLGDDRGTDSVSPYVAAARVADAAGLPPTYLEVGELDIYRDECLAYAQQLLRSGVSTEFHLHRGVPHGSDIWGPGLGPTQRARADRLRVLRGL